MKADEGLKDDLLSYVARMREEQYPELADGEVAKVLEAVAKKFRYAAWESQTVAQAEFEKARRLEEPKPRRDAPQWLAATAADSERDPNFSADFFP